MQSIDIVRAEFLSKVEILQDIDTSKNTSIAVYYDIEQHFEIEKFVHTNTPFSLVKHKENNHLGVIDLYVPNEFVDVAKALEKSDYKRLFVDVSGSMVPMLESENLLGDIISKLPEGAWEIISFDTKIVGDVIVSDKSKIADIITKNMTGSGTLLDCIADRFPDDMDYLLCDGCTIVPEYMHGIKAFRGIWAENIHPSNTVNLI